MKLTHELQAQIDNYFDNISASEFMKTINKQKHITYHELKAKIYHYSVHLFTLDFSDKQAQKELKQKLKKLDCKFKVKKHLQEGRGWCIEILAASVVLIDTKRMQKDAMSVLSAIRHETHHAAKECLDYIGSEFGADDEHFMYICDWFFSKAVEVVFGNVFGSAILPKFEVEAKTEIDEKAEDSTSIVDGNEATEDSSFYLFEHLKTNNDFELQYDSEAAYNFYFREKAIEIVCWKESKELDILTRIECLPDTHPKKIFAVSYHSFSTLSQFNQCLEDFNNKLKERKTQIEDTKQIVENEEIKDES